jgi:hypothetical protein
MLEGLKSIVSAALNAGINVNAADVTMGPDAINALPFTRDTYNWSAGRAAGWTTRYGIFPVPGHNSNEDGDAIDSGVLSGYAVRGLVAAEQTPAAHTTADYDVYGRRKFLLGAAVVQLPVGTGDKSVPVVYWISTRTSGANHQIDLLPSTSVVAGGQRMGVRSHLEAGVGGGTAVLSFVAGDDEIDRTLRAIDRLHTTDLTSLRKIPADFTKYLRWTILQTSVETNLREFVGTNPAADITVDTAGLPVDVYFNMAGSPYWNNGRSQRRSIGLDVSLSGSAALATAPKKWAAKAYLSEAAGDLTGDPVVNRSQTGVADVLGGVLYASDLANATYSTSGAYPAAGSTHIFGRVDDQPSTVPLTVIAMVTDRPLIAAINPLLRDSTEADTTSTAADPPDGGNDFVQWIDPTANMWAPRLFNTALNGTLGSRYPETQAAAGVAIAKQTCWQNAPAYIFGTNTSNVVTAVGGALAANTTYEYGYAVYNALTGKESNVGSPAKAFVAAANSAIRVQIPMNPLMFGAQTSNTQFPAIPELFDEGSAAVQAAVPFNYLAYRLYYRELGSFEWLYAGEASFASVYFEPFAEALYIGKTGAVGPSGGQPQGYNDYGDLPVDDYIDVISFQGRLFWMTKQMIRYSNGDDVLSYATRNYLPCPSGEFRGGLVHFFPGSENQDGRIVVFGSDGNYDVRETGEYVQEQVRVSATAQPVALPLDGSDITLSVRSSDTAFSGRCAVAAEGVVYFMGPTGIFRDDGVDVPKRISQAVEPDYFDAYDKTATDEFFAYYNKRSREILFFYRPSGINPELNEAGYKTKAWVYSLRTERWAEGVRGAFCQYGYTALIDWAQDLDVTKFEEVAHGPGIRTLIGARREAASTVSRPYYHDDDCDGGDYKPGDEMMVKEVTKPDASTLRLWLADGYSSTILNAVVAGTTKISVAGSSTYGDMPTAASVDGYYTVKAKDAVAATIDIAITGSMGSVSATAFTPDQYFPVFVEGYHDVACVLDHNYIAGSKGLFGWVMFRFFHMLFKPVRRRHGDATPRMTVAWQANHQIGETASSKSLPLFGINTRETTSQIVADVPSDAMQAEGQAVKATLTYNQIAGRWTLYFLAHHYDDKGAGEIMHYQRNFG